MNGAGLLLGLMKSSLRDPEVDLELVIFLSCRASSPLYESEESDDEAGEEDAASEGSPALGRGQRLSFKMNL